MSLCSLICIFNQLTQNRNQMTATTLLREHRLQSVKTPEADQGKRYSCCFINFLYYYCANTVDKYCFALLFCLRPEMQVPAIKSRQDSSLRAAPARPPPEGDVLP